MKQCVYMGKSVAGGVRSEFLNISGVAGCRSNNTLWTLNQIEFCSIILNSCFFLSPSVCGSPMGGHLMENGENRLQVTDLGSLRTCPTFSSLLTSFDR